MTNYNRTIGRIVTQAASAYPAWRQAMTDPKKLYVMNGTHPGFTTGLLPSVLPSHFGAADISSFGAGWDVLSGFSSGTWLPVGGQFGTMVYATGGHTRLQNQILGLSLDAGSYSWWRQPEYQTSDTAGANLYYDPAAAVQTIGEDGATWNRQFPVKFDGWVFPRPLTDGNMGNNVPHGMRYVTCCYVPASVSGSDDLLLTILGPQGPFAQSYRPSNVTDAEWFDAAWVWPSGRRKQPIYVLNLRTGLWSRVGIHPDLVNLGGFASAAVQAAPGTRKAWVSVSAASQVHYSLDFTNFPSTGQVTVGPVVAPSVNFGPNRYCQGALTAGSPYGHLVWVWPDSQLNGSLVIQDLAAGVHVRVDLSSKGLFLPLNIEKVGTSYDAANNRMLVVVWEGNPPSLANGITCWEIVIPADYTNAAAYTVTKNVLTQDAAVPNLTTLTAAEYYGKTQYLPALGVCLVPFHSTMLAFRI